MPSTASFTLYLGSSKTLAECIAGLDNCDRPLWDWLASIPDGARNPTQQKFYNDFLTRFYNEMNPTDSGSSGGSGTSTDGKLRVSLHSAGGFNGGGGSPYSGLRGILHVPFQPPNSCSVLPYTLTHDIKQVFANNRTNEATLNVSVGGGSNPNTGGALTGDAIVNSALNLKLSLATTRYVDYQVQFQDYTAYPAPAEVASRVEPYDQTKMKFEVEDPLIGWPFEGWEVYVELVEKLEGAIFWCGWGIPFKQPWKTTTSHNQGGGTDEFDAKALFNSHPGVALSMLNDYVKVTGGEGQWEGRVVVYNSRVHNRVADISYGDYPVARGEILPGAELYVAHPAYNPGVSSGMTLKAPSNV